MATKEKRRAEQINQTLFEISQIVNTTNSLAELYKKVHISLGKVLDVSNFFVAIYDTHTNKMRFPYYIDTMDDYYIADGTTGMGDLENIIEYSTNPTKGSMTAMVIEKGVPLLITKQWLIDYCKKEGCKPIGSPPEVWLGAPMMSGGKVLGVIAVQSYTNPDLFCEEDIFIISSVSNQLAIAVKRKTDEKSLHHRELGHRDMLSNISEISYSTDKSGAITYINLVADTLLDLPQIEVTKQRKWFRFLAENKSKVAQPKMFEELIHPDDRVRVAIMLDQYNLDNTSFQIEYRIKTGRGKNRWVLEKGRFFPSESGGVRLKGIILDIHDQKRAELTNKTLFNIANAVKSSSNLGDLYQTIYESLNQIINVRNFYIAIYDKVKDRISFPFDIDEADNDQIVEIINVSQSTSLTGEVIRTGKPLLVTKSEAQNLIGKYGGEFIGEPAELWLGAPLKVRDEVIGAMVTQSYTDPEMYDAKDVETFLSVSDQVATAIDRKRHEDELLIKELELRTLYEISNAINTTFNKSELYQSIHKSLQRIIDVKNMGIALYHEDSDVMEYPYLVDEKEGEGPLIIQNASQVSLAYEVISRGKPISLNRDGMEQLIANKGVDMIGYPSESWLGLPLKGKDKILGAIIVQNYDEPDRFKQKEIDLLESVSGQIAFAIERKQAEADLAATQRELIEYAHKVGMADIANSTLHNVGNILNSVKTSTEQIHIINQDSDFRNFKLTNNLLREKMEMLGEGIGDKKMANKLVEYYDRLEIQFENERSLIREQVDRLNSKIGLMTDVITTQQNFTNASFMTGNYSLEEIVEDVLLMQADMLFRHQISIKKSFEKVPTIQVQRTKLVHIIINLIINAKDAMLKTPIDQRILDISLKRVEEKVHLGIRDTGVGISDDDFTSIFTHGFTTKKSGHGFGLHNSAIYLEEMKGQIWAESEGPDKGALFNIILPITPNPHFGSAKKNH